LLVWIRQAMGPAARSIRGRPIHRQSSVSTRRECLALGLACVPGIHQELGDGLRSIEREASVALQRGARFRLAVTEAKLVAQFGFCTALVRFCSTRRAAALPLALAGTDSRESASASATC